MRKSVTRGIKQGDPVSSHLLGLVKGSGRRSSAARPIEYVDDEITVTAPTAAESSVQFFVKPVRGTLLCLQGDVGWTHEDLAHECGRRVKGMKSKDVRFMINGRQLLRGNVSGTWASRRTARCSRCSGCGADRATKCRSRSPSQWCWAPPERRRQLGPSLRTLRPSLEKDLAAEEVAVPCAGRTATSRSACPRRRRRPPWQLASVT